MARTCLRSRLIGPYIFYVPVPWSVHFLGASSLARTFSAHWPVVIQNGAVVAQYSIKDHNRFRRQSTAPHPGRRDAIIAQYTSVQCTRAARPRAVFCYLLMERLLNYRGRQTSGGLSCTYCTPYLKDRMQSAEPLWRNRTKGA